MTITRVRKHHECEGAWRFASFSEPSRLLFVGEDNPQSADPRLALWPHHEGVAGDRLARILAISRGELVSHWRTNLCNPTWDLRRARERAALLGEADVENPNPWSTIVMLGLKVASAFGKIHGVVFEPFESRKLGAVRGACTYAYLPHPSGRNQTWNDPEKIRLARSFWSVLSKS